MRVKDIEVGQEYAIRYSVQALVLETGVPRSTYSGKIRKDGIRCRVIEPKHMAGREEIFSSQEVKELWSEKQTRLDQRKREQEVRQRLEKLCVEKTQDYKKQLGKLGLLDDDSRVSHSYAINLDPTNFQVNISLNNQQVERLLAMLESPQAQQRAQELDQSASQRSSSALDNLFS